MRPLLAALLILVAAPAQAQSLYATQQPAQNAMPAQKTAPAAVPPAQQESVALVNAVQTYLSSIRTMTARFMQTAHDGSQVAGDFALKRPGRMRFDYDAPVADFIVADGTMIYYYDGQLKQQSSTLISHSLADFFLRPDLQLDSKDLQVSDVRRDAGLVQLTLTQRKDPLAGSLTLGLTENPMQLKKWRVVDAQGLVTEVELFNVAEGGKLDNDIFHYYDPKLKKPRYNK